jgi:hypothetical protein
MPYLLAANPGSPSSWVKMDHNGSGSNGEGNNSGGSNGHQDHMDFVSALPPNQTGSIRRSRLPGVPVMSGNNGTSTLPSAKYSNYINTALAQSASMAPVSVERGSPLANGGPLHQSNGLFGVSSAAATPPNMLSPASGLGNYSASAAAMNRTGNLSHLNLSLVPRTNRYKTNV